MIFTTLSSVVRLTRLNHLRRLSFMHFSNDVLTSLFFLDYSLLVSLTPPVFSSFFMSFDLNLDIFLPEKIKVLYVVYSKELGLVLRDERFLYIQQGTSYSPRIPEVCIYSLSQSSSSSIWSSSATHSQNYFQDRERPRKIQSSQLPVHLC